jgi:hypothetical protein
MTNEPTAYVEGRFALQHEVALVFAGVGLRGDHIPGREARLYAREDAVESFGRELVGYAQGEEVGALVGTYQ